MKWSLRFQISVLLGAFALLVLVASGATLWGVQTQAQDALVINLSGRQRMLVERMAFLSIEVTHEIRPEYAAELQAAAETFERTLSAFEQGGETPYLPGQEVSIPPAQSAQVRAALTDVRAVWTPFREAVEAVLQGRNESALITELTPELVARADVVVRRYEAESARKVTRLHNIQVGFLISTLGLLIWGVWWLYRTVLLPLQGLEAAALRIKGGDLQTPVRPSGPVEFHQLAESFDSMRASLAASRQALQDWAETLETRVAQRTAELEALNNVTLDIAAQLDVGRVLDSIAGNARRLLGAEVAALCLLDEEAARLYRQTTSGPAQAFTARREVSLEVVGEVFRQEAHCVQCRVPCNMVTQPYQRHHLAVSLKSDERILGAFCVANSGEQPFSEDAPLLLSGLANAAAIAIQNARLYTRAEHTATLEERQRLATRLHDGLGQILASVHLLADRTLDEFERLESGVLRERLERIRRASAEASRVARQAIASLAEAAARPVSLQARLRQHIADLQACASCDILVEDHLPRPLFLEKDRGEQVLYIIQEAVWNAIRHAEASEIRVLLSREEAGFLCVTVEDNGRGFNPQAAAAGEEGHFGLSIMRTRAEFLHGSIEIISAPSEGTRIILCCPLEKTHEPIPLAAG